MNRFTQLRRWTGLTACILGTILPARGNSASVKTNSPGFVLELGNNVRTVQITPEYKEAALQATLPLFSEFAHKLQLPVPYPLTRGDIVECGVTPFQEANGEIDTVVIGTKQGFSFRFFQGNVRAFNGPDSYGLMQSKHTVTNFFSTVKITREQAIQLARGTLKKLGIPPEDLFAEQEPQVELPTSGTNTIARYIIKWNDPRGGDNGPVDLEAEVNAETGRVESFRFLPMNGLQKSAPKVAVVPPSGHGMFDSRIPPPVNPEYAWKLIPIMLKAIDEYTRNLSLPVPRPLTTNNVAKIEIHNNGGWPHSEIALTNGWRFIYRHCMVNGYYAPDNFFNSDDRKIHVRNFEGKWNLTTNQALAVIKTAISKLKYPTNQIHMDVAVWMHAASVDRERIPRLFFEWPFSVQDELQSRLEAEVNMDSGKLESFYYDDKTYWGCRPPIDLPISTR